MKNIHLTNWERNKPETFGKYIPVSLLGNVKLERKCFLFGKTQACFNVGDTSTLLGECFPQ